VVAPSDLLGKYGSDAIRVFICFAAPPEQNLEWSDSAVAGSYKFLNKVWALSHELGAHMSMSSLDEAKKYPQAMAHLWQIQQDYSKNQFNTVISGLMKLVNFMGQNQMTPGASGWFLKMLLMNLYPFAPQITYVILEQCGVLSLGHQPIDQVDPSWTQSDEVMMVIQINGKMRHQLSMPRSWNNSEVEQCVLSEEKVKDFLEDKPIKKCIVVPGRLVNLVI
jgi:leucyl-tRNA synthetase